MNNLFKNLSMYTKDKTYYICKNIYLKKNNRKNQYKSTSHGVYWKNNLLTLLDNSFYTVIELYISKNDSLSHRKQHFEVYIYQCWTWPIIMILLIVLVKISYYTQMYKYSLNNNILHHQHFKKTSTSINILIFLVIIIPIMNLKTHQ